MTDPIPSSEIQLRLIPEVPEGFVRMSYVKSGVTVTQTVRKEFADTISVIEYDPVLHRAYDQKIASLASIQYPILDLDYILEHTSGDSRVFLKDLSGETFVIGKTNYTESFQISFSKHNLDTRDILSTITDCMTPETSSSSPSMILHQFCSFTLLRTLTSGKGIFENKLARFTPDITIDTGRSIYNFEMTTFHMADYKLSRGVKLVMLDKYTLFDYYLKQSVTDNRTLFPILRRLSLANDQGDARVITELFSSQNITKRSSVYSEDILQFFRSTPEKELEDMCNLANNAMIKMISSKSDLSLVNAEFNYAHPFSDNIGYDFTKLFGFLYNIVNNYTNDTEYVEADVQVDFEVFKDKVCLVGETDQLSDPFYKRDRQQILITKDMMQVMSSYLTKKKLLQMDSELRYYKECMVSFTPRSREYFRSKGTAVLKLQKEENSEPVLREKSSKTFKGLNRVVSADPTPNSPVFPSLEGIEFAVYDDLRESKHFFDPLHDKMARLLIQDAELMADVVNILSQSKIYQLLLLFAKGAQAVLYGKSDGSTLITKHPKLDIELHMYTSGSATETDKGVTYTTIVTKGRPVKTYLWRPSDLKSYSVAATRLVSAVMGAATHVPRTHLRRLVTLYSLIIYENSWGLSKILKPYRYFVMSQAFGNTLIGLSYKKVKEAISSNLEMCKRKMSMAFMYVLCQHLNETVSKTPLLSLNQSQAGFEMFLVNICPSSTYGKRRHRCNVLKELAAEIRLSEDNQEAILTHNEKFMKLVNSLKRDQAPSSKMIKITSYIREIISDGRTRGSRFTYSPLSILLTFRILKDLTQKHTFGVENKTISQLCTMKSSFDPISFKNDVALSSITNLVKTLNTPTTPLTALAVIKYMPIDLTYRMFDKDQVGSDREISILSSEFRILQSITESFSRMVANRTQVDMLSNPDKVGIMCSYQNETTKNYGVRETIDQTRWGPNFNTSLFGYMFAVIGRYTTEAFIPMLTCFLSELKVFSMNPYPELSHLQKIGYTLPGLIGQFHMGQGIFHFTSSLYHSVVTMNICRQREQAINSSKVVLYSKPMVTSDDVCIFNYIPMSKVLKTTDFERGRAYQILDTVISNYSWQINVYGILTSTYKNVVSKDSVEFNSVFLHSSAVGSNALKFLYSLIDPYTTGNKLRDARNIFDSYSDAINSSLNPYEAKIVLVARLITTFLRWAESNEIILKVLDVLGTEIHDQYFPIRCQTRTRSENKYYGLRCRTVLPHKTYELASKNLQALRAVEPRFEIQSIYLLKESTLAKAKERKLGSNKGIVMSRKMRKIARIGLGVGNAHGGFDISLPAYVTSVMINKGEFGLTSPEKSSILAPTRSVQEHMEGFQTIFMKVTKGMRLSHTELLISSYDRVSYITADSTDREIYLHILRKYKILQFVNMEEISQLNYHERAIKFDEYVSEAMISGSTRRLLYTKAGEHSTLVFPFPGSILGTKPSFELSKTETSLLGLCPSEIPTFALVNRGSKAEIIQVTVGENRSIIPVVEEYVTNDFMVERCMVDLFTSDETFKLDPDDITYINFSLVFVKRPKESEVINENLEVEKRVIEEISMGVGSSQVKVDELSDDLIEKLQRAIAQVGLSLDVVEHEEERKETVYDTKVNLLNGLFGTSNKKTIIKKFSMIVHKSALMLNQGWFMKHSIMNGILFDMIDKGFIQNLTDTQPQTLMYSYSNGDRRPSSARPIQHNGMKYFFCLAATFNIVETLNAAYRSFSDHERFVSDAAKMRKLISFLNDPLMADSCLLSGLPSGFEFSDQPTGYVLETWDAEQLFQEIEHKEYVEDIPTVREKGEEDFIPEDPRWGDYYEED